MRKLLNLVISIPHFWEVKLQLSLVAPGSSPSRGDFRYPRWSQSFPSNDQLAQQLDMVPSSLGRRLPGGSASARIWATVPPMQPGRNEDLRARRVEAHQNNEQLFNFSTSKSIRWLVASARLLRSLLRTVLSWENSWIFPILNVSIYKQTTILTQELLTPS